MSVLDLGVVIRQSPRGVNVFGGFHDLRRGRGTWAYTKRKRPGSFEPGRLGKRDRREPGNPVDPEGEGGDP